MNILRKLPGYGIFDSCVLRKHSGHKPATTSIHRRAARACHRPADRQPDHQGQDQVIRLLRMPHLERHRQDRGQHQAAERPSPAQAISRQERPGIPRRGPNVRDNAPRQPAQRDRVRPRTQSQPSLQRGDRAQSIAPKHKHPILPRSDARQSASRGPTADSPTRRAKPADRTGPLAGYPIRGDGRRTRKGPMPMASGPG